MFHKLCLYIDTFSLQYGQVWSLPNHDKNEDKITEFVITYHTPTTNAKLMKDLNCNAK